MLPARLLAVIGLVHEIIARGKHAYPSLLQKLEPVTELATFEDAAPEV